MLQIIYEGDPNADLTLQGLVEGQSKISRLEYENIRARLQEDQGGWENRRSTALFGLTLLFMAVFSGVLGILAWRTRLPAQIKVVAPPPAPAFVYLSFWSAGIVLLTISIYVFYQLVFIRPPLSFVG